jgi:hypothetical protein
MATGRGAALLAASRGLTDLAGIGSQAAQNISRSKREDEELDMQRQLFESRMKGQQQSQELAGLQIGEEKNKRMKRQKASKLTEDIQVALATERSRRKTKQAVDKEIDGMSPQKLDVEFGTTDPQQAKQLAYTDIQMPEGKSDAEIINQFKPEIQRFQFISPEVQGIQAGVTQEAKRGQKLEDITSERGFRVSEREAGEEFRTSEREAAQDFQAEQRALDRAAVAAKATASKQGKTPPSNAFQAATFGLRIKQAEDVFNTLEGAGFDPTTLKNRIIQKGDVSAIKDPQQKQYAQALRNFINATLRRESGAAIAPSEFDSAIKQYFPQLGDDPQTQQQRRENRQAVQAGLVAEAGEAFNMVQNQFSQIKAQTPSTTIPQKGAKVGRFTVEEVD